MGDIDWSKLNEATSEENRPTPGYLFNEIIQNVSHADPQKVPAVANFLIDCVDGDHAHVKLKALFVIKTLAYRIPPFCKCMQEHLPSVHQAAAFSGPPSALYGDEPYRLVRDAAEGALQALTGAEHYHEQYKHMSQRIVGFGNYLPDADTVLADGTVNVGRDITLSDIVSSSVGYVAGSVGSVLVGVKDLVANSFDRKTGIFGEDGIIDVDGEGLGEAAEDEYDGTATGAEEEEVEEEEPEEEDYHPSTGTYVPPYVPPAPPNPGPDEGGATGGASVSEEDLISFPNEGVATVDLLHVDVSSPTEDVDEVLSEAAILELLGIDASGDSASKGGGQGSKAGPDTAEVDDTNVTLYASLLDVDSAPVAEGVASLPGAEDGTPVAAPVQVKPLPGGFMEV